MRYASYSVALNRLRRWEHEQMTNANGMAWAAERAIQTLKDYLRVFQQSAAHSPQEKT